MNIKKYSLKTMCAALACTTVLSSMLAAYATDTTVYETPMDDSAEINSINALANDSVGTDTSESGWTTEENSFEDIKVTYQQSSSYTVTIPKTIALDTKKQAAYSVKVSGEIGSDQRVYVAPVDKITDSENLDFYMSDLSGKKENVVATVTQSKTYWSSEDVANSYEETNNSVSAPDLSAGTWEGTFQVEIRLESNTTQGGEESDPYEVAPAEAYSNWNYTLDDANDIITLNYYTGSETDVIVYANYEIDGKTYKTQIKSNDTSVSASYKVAYMFNGEAQANCQNIKTIKFSSSIDTSNVTNMAYMFRRCNSLIELDINSFNTSNVTDMQGMFSGTILLTSLDVRNFSTSKVTNMSNMFEGCHKLTSLDLCNFDTSNVANMDYLFNYCYALVSLDLSSFDTSNATNMGWMFYGDSKLKTIYVTEGKWSTSQAKTGYMFTNCGTSSVTYK